ncbi:hypothetical protein PWT90_00050 [Aphanocladium album]|nr:hypothetical protein PWT90_00050 [Aphanocladium album]
MAAAVDTFRIARAPLSERYRISPETITLCSSYSLDVKPRTNAQRPFMVLHDDSQKRICGLVRRPMNSSTFEIRLGSAGSLHDGKSHPKHSDGWVELTHRSNDTAVWSICLASGQRRTFAWVRSSISLAGRGMRLFDITEMSDLSTGSLEGMHALANFERKKGLTSFGALEVDNKISYYGEDFVQMLLLTAMCLVDQTSKRGTNSLGWGSRGFEDR